MFNPLARYPVTQTWAQHVINRGLPGSVAGGIDYDVPYGTPLPILAGVLEWVTRWSLRKPSWYNTGLGNAAAYRRPDGTRTVYGHNSRRSGRQVFSGDSGTSSGPHVHAHDVLADGHTRVPPFSTINAGGGASASAPESEESEMKLAIVRYTDGTYHPFLLAAGTYTELGPATLAAWRDGQPKHKGPLGAEFTWDATDWHRARRSLRALDPAEDVVAAGVPNAA